MIGVLLLVTHVVAFIAGGATVWSLVVHYGPRVLDTQAGQHQERSKHREEGDPWATRHRHSSRPYV